ncbi:MAG: N(5)-(carboxyethyl)ornithine synthase [Jiangellales bacterium]
MTLLTLGVLGTSTKENEKRVPIHPRHLDRIDADLRAVMLLEAGYGDDFGLRDAELAPLVAGVVSRSELVERSDVVLMPKPTLADVAGLRDGQVVWGWPHCVQDAALTQLAIDKRLTLIAWEAMHFWDRSGNPGVHVFHRNNEIAGYASVLHAMALTGTSGAYGRRLSAVVLGYGNTARGAIAALQALGVWDVVALTKRDVTAVSSPMPSVLLGHIERAEQDPSRTVTHRRAGNEPTHEFLAEHDIVVNCILQDTDAPIMFVTTDELAEFRPGTLIVDVSCDEGMGFEFARPTPFTDPMFTVGHDIHYYGVDHSPSYLWNSATWEISEALLPFVRSVLRGPSGWEADETIARAIEVKDGLVVNPKILTFQKRAAQFPHEVVERA